MQHLLSLSGFGHGIKLWSFAELATPYNEENVVHLTILNQNGAETDFRGPKVTPIGAGWTKKMKHYVWDT